MKKMALMVTAGVLAACQTTGTGTSRQTESQGEEQIIVTASKRSEVAPLTAPIPSPSQQISMGIGSVSYLSAPPSRTKICWDGMPAGPSGMCSSSPPFMKTCWDGSSLSGGASCPVRPTFTCPDGSVVPGGSGCVGKVERLAGGFIAETMEPEFETVTETIVVKPGETKTVDIPPQYETVTETYITQEATTELVAIPPVYNADGSIKTPASTVERAVPAVTKTRTRRALKPGTGVTEISVPEDGEAVSHKIEKQLETSPMRWIIRNPEGRIIREFKSADEFAKFTNNPYKRVAEEPVSTFSADVDTASYGFVRQFVKDGRNPPEGSVRVEEMINYFDYNYETPKGKADPFKPNISVVPSPWSDQTKLVHIGLKGYDIPDRKRPDMNLVFLIDVSGSMNAENKLALLKR